MQTVLTIAGSDSGGGAGIQADLKTFQELKVFGTSAITAITAQNTQDVAAIQAVKTSMVSAQIKAVLDDFNIRIIKTGMLYNAEIIKEVAKALSHYRIPIVVDPVMIAKSGVYLLKPDAIQQFKQDILPLSYLITPNIQELEELTGIKNENNQHLIESARVLTALGARNVLIKGGHLEDKFLAHDYLFTNHSIFQISAPRIPTQNTHGTGCTLSAAIVAFLAKGSSLLDAVIMAKRFIQMAIENPIKIGHGHGPLNHKAFQENLSTPQVLIEEIFL